MSNSKNVISWKKKVKGRVVELMGGRCQICGYDKTISALELHHIDPKEKGLSFGGVKANLASWREIALELKKCIMLCSNCHKEVHDGVTKIPKRYETFNEDFFTIRSDK